VYDIAIIGGGVNGCGIARDAAGRGLSVYLAERDDLASGTSSKSTKLIHGGLRYLEHCEFRLVRESLIEREVLLRIAPHIIWPLRFVLPHHGALRPSWLIRAGLFLYDYLGGREILPASHGIDLTRDVAGAPLQSRFIKGFEYSDCWVDDARLVVLNAMDAKALGAVIETRTEVVSAHRAADHWNIETASNAGASQQTISARVLINAAGPWVDDILTKRTALSNQAKMRLVKGSHIVVPRQFDHDKAYIFQNADRRIIFAIPYEGDFTLIGTTDVDYTGDPGAATISNDEIRYLCQSANAYFRNPITEDSVVWSYSGVRPLLDQGGGTAQEATRDFVLELNDDNGTAAPILNVCGGKITTYRRLAELAIEKISSIVPAGKSWTANAPLPGGDLSLTAMKTLAKNITARIPGLTEKTARRLARTYGTIALTFAEGGGGTDFGAGLWECEVRHLVDNEWARTADDILWRRTKLGLAMDEAGRRKLDDWLKQNVTSQSPSAT
jgi:glycerol-3-phosphate dehydrogenase